ncbi:MAG TPA: hypothetical protein VF598_13465 [Hymenobacter sp.]|jgi:hypothetical protein
MSYPFLNTYITHTDEERYSIYWTSEYAAHVVENLGSPDHGMLHTEVAQILRKARYIVPHPKRGPY